VGGGGEAVVGDEGGGGGEGVGLALEGPVGEGVEAEAGEGGGEVGLEPAARDEGEVEVAVEHVLHHAGVVRLVEDDLRCKCISVSMHPEK
jgi:hypothetical protein